MDDQTRDGTMRETFAVGRVDRKSREVVWLQRRREPSFPGPWRVRAVVGPSAGTRTRAPAASQAPDPAPPTEAAEAPEAAPDATGGPPADAPSPVPSPDGADRPQLDLFA